ncbi:unnamed protein product [Diamesa serratosioi]
MSATFKLAKKKFSQHDLRKLMQESKSSRAVENVKKVDSPLAKYNEAGQLTCVLCKTVVRSESVWTVHVNAKQHKENVTQAKKLKDKLEAKPSPTPKAMPTLAGIKRTIEVMRSEVPEKKVKGILKNSSSSSVQMTHVIPSTNETIPNDFFDTNAKSETLSNVQGTDNKESEKVEENMQVDDEELPEGFFDDPKKDAKARHQEYKDPNDEEWEKFQKEIKEATTMSANIIAEEQEEATVERQLDELDEQIRNWSRVLTLEKQKELVQSRPKQASTDEDDKMSESSESDDDDDDENTKIPEFLDWRAKKSLK